VIRAARALALALAALGLGALAPCVAHAAPTVILLSWDGVRHDQPERAATTALARMQRDGARAERLVPVFPSSTFPGHVSLATGTYPDRHGILDNQFFDRERGEFQMANDAAWIEAEPLWAAAERQGVPAAVYFWVGSETDWRGRGARHRMAPFDSRVSEAEKVRQIVRWLDLPGPDRPRLIMAWWHGTDDKGHARGPADASVARALLAQASELATLLAALDARDAWRDTTLLLVSDHGMTEVSQNVPLRTALRDAGVEARVVAGGAVGHVFLADLAQRERAEQALAKLPGIQTWRREALPAALRLRHPTRTGDLVVVASPPYALRESPFVERASRALASPLGWKRGLHGYSPDHPDMGGIFFALGRGVPPGARLGAVRMIDVAPTVARLLGIEAPAQSEGTPIPRIGE
jgi:predicted AlkP superfamily pyrophosphatase or phosphodiesterase